MAFSLRNNDLFEENMILKCRIKHMSQIIEEFESGERYQKIQRDHSKIVDGYIKEIKKLHSELADAHAQTVDVRHLWTDECEHIWDEHQSEIDKKDTEIDHLKKKNLELLQKYDKDIYELKGYINSAIHDRNKRIKKSSDSFDKAYIEKFNRDVDGCLEKGWKENETLGKRYGWNFERALLRRIAKHRKNYFMWLSDFSIPVTNNLSERGLRGVKSHMKISGQFESVNAADNYAMIRSYIETCRRNGINEIDALIHLSAGRPYTVKEIFKT